MRVVIDANILFSALIKNSVSTELLLSKKLDLFAPEFILQEVSKHRKLLARKTHMSKEEFFEVFLALKRRIAIVDDKEVRVFLEDADRISPDPNDSPYFAAAIMLGIPIWSDDKALKKQERVIVYNTEELLKILGFA